MVERVSVTPQPCPDEAEIAEFVQGELPESQAERLEAHLDSCEACAQVVAELVRIFEGEDDSSAAPRPEPEPEPLQSEELAVTINAAGGSIERPIGRLLRAGAEVGRYRVLDCVGVGGMGVVYAAYDPELDRRVALKLLRGSSDDAGSQGRSARLLREAQALARLTHPNVITVHDVGTWEGQVFVAMEYVDGPTLKQWMSERRTWAEIQEVFVAAGRGLVAAHEADLVHRDFKPDNVLIGRDGRVRVTDFGLARWGRAVGSTADLLATDELLASQLRQSNSGAIPTGVNPEVSLTRTGTLVGTPAYMAPEQHQHRTADAASDQFSFCVVLFEAIYGERPFTGRTLVELASNVLDGRIPDSSPAATVPRAVRQAVRRGLSRRRRDRFGSMVELLAVLEGGAARRRWPWLALAIPLVGAAGGLWAVAGAETPTSAFCGSERGLDEIWNETRAEAIRTAFEETGLSYANASADRASSALDEYAGRWNELRARSCDASGAAEEGPAIVALRERCLERRRVSLQALLGAFERPEAQTVARAVGAVAGLPDVERCGDSEALMADLPPTPPPELRDEVEAVRDELARGEGLVAAGRYADGLALARTLDEQADEIGHRPLRAETQLMLGEMLDRVGEAEEAAGVLEEASLSAVASRHRRILVRALLARIYVLGMGLSQVEEAEGVARWAEAEIEGTGMDDALSALWLNRGTVAYRKGDYDAADGFMRRALALRDRDRNPMRWADAAFNLATLSMIRGDEQEAIVKLREYVEVFEGQLGRMHPEVASGYHNLGVAYSNAGMLSKADEALRQAEEIRRATLGPSHPEYASTLNMMGSNAIDMGKVEEGMALSLRSLEILEQGGAEASALAFSRIELAKALVELRRLDEAKEQANVALTSIETELGVEHPELASALWVLGKVAALRGDVQTVLRHMDRAYAVRTAVLGEDHADAVKVLVDRAKLLSLAGESERALSELFELLERFTDEPPSESTALIRFALAEVLWKDPLQRSRARAQARQVVRNHQAGGMPLMVTLGRQWLDEHPSDDAAARAP